MRACRQAGRSSSEASSYLRLQLPSHRTSPSPAVSLLTAGAKRQAGRQGFGAGGARAVPPSSPNPAKRCVCSCIVVLARIE